MREKRAEIVRVLESVVGQGYVTTGPELNVDELKSALMVRPGSAREAAECLKVCADEGKAVIPAGLATWLDGGNPVRRADVVLSLERMNRIIEYSPPDLTVAAEAGLAISELNAAVRPERQWLPLDPPGSSRASLGAIAACASSGALRLGFGTPRDYVIGLKLAHIDGTESRSGGKVVKNVAGYDMNKLYIGSFGTLAVITELVFKLRPLPERSCTVVVISKDLQSLARLAKQVLDSELQPASVFLAKFLAKGLTPESLGSDR